MLFTTSRLLSCAALAALSGQLLAQAPANDDCGNAIVVLNGVNGPFSNVGSSTSAPGWPCALGGNDVWFLFQSGAAGTLQADLCGVATWDTAIEIFDGAAGCGSLVSLGCNDDTCALQSSLAVPVNAGLYYIRVGGWNGTTGSFSLNVNGPAGGGTGNVLATNTSLGQGCIRQFSSFYEYFALSTSFDLANSSMSMLFNGAGYLMLPGITAYVAPSATATALALTDDSNTSVTLSSPLVYPGGTTTALSVCSNGYVSVNPAGNGTAYTPVVATMLGAANTGWWAQHDYNPTLPGSGQVKFEEVAGVAYITWDAVYSYGTTSPETFQLQFELSTGNVHFVWGAISGAGNGFLVGYSPGGASADPGGRDISATLPLTFMTDPADVLPLTLSATSRPVTGTNWNLSVGNVPATGLIGVDVFGVSDPGITDLFFLGAPGCGLRASLDYTAAWFVTPTAGHTYSLPIPNSPSLINFNIYSMSAVFQAPPVNSFGAITSNGIQGMVGNL